MLSYIESNVTSIEGKIDKGEEYSQTDSFALKSLIYPVIRDNDIKGTGIFVQLNCFLTVTSVLYNKNKKKGTTVKEDTLGNLFIRIRYHTTTVLKEGNIDVIDIHYPNQDRAEMRKNDPAILIVSYCVKNI